MRQKKAMWQELSELRELFLSRRRNPSEEYEKKAMLLFLYETLKLTGNGISKQVFIDMTLTGERPHNPQGSRAYDLWKAFLYVKETAATHQKLSAGWIQKVAMQVMKHTGRELTTTVGEYDTSLGDFRLGEDYDELYPLSDYRKIPEHLEIACQDVNLRIDKVQGVQTVHLAADFMYTFAHIKPFGAGNLETGLLLMNYIQMYHSEPLIIIFAEDRPLLWKALKRGEINQTPAVFENFVASEQIKLLKQATSFGLQ